MVLSISYISYISTLYLIYFLESASLLYRASGLDCHRKNPIKQWCAGWSGRRLRVLIRFPGGDMASTWVTKLQVHAEVQVPRKTVCKLLVANDDNYALAA